MATVVPVLSFTLIDEAYIRFVNQRRSFQCLPRLLLAKLLRRQFPQLVIDERQEFFGGVGVALLDGAKYLRDIAHEAENTLAERCKQVGGQGVRKGSALPWCSIEMLT